MQPADRGLTLRIGYSPVEVPLTPSGSDTDTWDAGRMELGFLRDVSEDITGFLLSSGRIRNVAFEKTR